MSAMSNRDKWLAASLPAMITLLLGWLIFLRPAGRDLAILRQRVTNLGSPSERQSLAVRARAESTEIEKVVATKREAPADEEIVIDRNLAMQHISLLCDQHDLNLSGASIAPGTKLPPAMEEATTALQGGASKAVPQVWRIELTGAYSSVLKLLEGLQGIKPLVVPLNVTMEAPRNERLPAKWVLLLWL